MLLMPATEEVPMFWRGLLLTSAVVVPPTMRLGGLEDTAFGKGPTVCRQLLVMAAFGEELTLCMAA